MDILPCVDWDSEVKLAASAQFISSSSTAALGERVNGERDVPVLGLITNCHTVYLQHNDLRMRCKVNRNLIGLMMEICFLRAFGSVAFKGGVDRTIIRPLVRLGKSLGEGMTTFSKAS